MNKITYTVVLETLITDEEYAEVKALSPEERAKQERELPEQLEQVIFVNMGSIADVMVELEGETE